MARGGRWRLVVAAAAAVTAVPAVTAAPALAVAPSCGAIITVDTTLTGDLSCPGDGLVIAASGVVLDLGGHTLDGGGFRTASAGVRLSSGATGAVVRNGRIREFGIGFDAMPGADGATVTGVSFAGNGNAARLTSDANHLRGNRFLPNVNLAILVRGHGNGVVGNSFGGNPYAVFAIGADGLSILGNGIVGDGGDDSGVFVGLGSDVRVSGNSVSGYTGRSGISLVSVDGEVSGNQVYDNGDGISITGSGVRVFGNHAFSNRDDGIEVRPGSAAVLSANLTSGNGDLGIEAPSATDGGGNRAFGNGDQRECTGVRCS